MKKLICLILLLSATRAWAQCPGGVCNTAPDYASVNNAVNTIARDGDIVNILPGTAHWAQALTITKGITLQGADDRDRKRYGRERV